MQLALSNQETELAQMHRKAAEQVFKHLGASRDLQLLGTSED
jgi:hypothetical protein